ncbi:MAG: metal-dependent transcriptional regulator [Firmicutes bacterium]|nr:metal-dependent transcriptional regulator [Bacillota bacterium]
MDNAYYTLTNYIHNNNIISYAMEDYIEMIYRKFINKEYLTITTLSNYLHIKKSSCSKMISKLKTQKLVYIENNFIYLTKNGFKIGKYLFKRHQIIENFLIKLNKDKFKLEQVEKIEHFIDNITLKNLEKLNNIIN